jgi:hypothetical protein
METEGSSLFSQEPETLSTLSRLTDQYKYEIFRNISYRVKSVRWEDLSISCSPPAGEPPLVCHPPQLTHYIRIYSPNMVVFSSISNLITRLVLATENSWSREKEITFYTWVWLCVLCACVSACAFIRECVNLYLYTRNTSSKIIFYLCRYCCEMLAEWRIRFMKTEEL